MIRTAWMMWTAAEENSRLNRNSNLFQVDKYFFNFLERKAGWKEGRRTGSDRGICQHWASSCRRTAKRSAAIKCARRETRRREVADSVERIWIPAISHPTPKVSNLPVQLSIHLRLVRQFPSRSAVPGVTTKLLPTAGASAASHRAADVPCRQEVWSRYRQRRQIDAS